MTSPNVPEAALALWLADHAEAGPIVFIARSDTRLDRLARACAGFCAGRVELLILPPWDVLPYDRVAPSAVVVGRRIATLARLTHPAERPRLLLTSADAALQLVPPARAWKHAGLRLAAGDPFDAAALRDELAWRGYHAGEAVSEAGEVAFRGHVMDILPAGATVPVRLTVHEGRIAALHCFDPATQRSHETIAEITLYPATEFPLEPEEVAHALEQQDAPVSTPSGRLVPIFDYLDSYRHVLDVEVGGRWASLREQVADAYEASRRTRPMAGGRKMLPRPDRLYLTPARAEAYCADRLNPVPDGVAEPSPKRASELIRRAMEAPGPVVVATPGDAAKLAHSLGRRGLAARIATDWPDAVAGGVACLKLDIGSGFVKDGLLVLRAADLVRADHHESTALPGGDGAPRVGDVVVHADHGAARLVGLTPVQTEGAAEERLVLRFAGDAELLAHPAELDRIWRTGTDGALDRIGGELWRRRRTEIDAEIDAAAGQLIAQAERRATLRAPAIEPDRAGYEQLARRFAYALSPDQRAAVDAVLADLRRPSPPMQRLLCGDVGFGKTEVALRAAAAVALCGHQVAITAPTTVLARQHLDTFQRRFAGSGIRVEALPPATDRNARAVRRGLAGGDIRIVVGTQALASDSVAFKQLGLVVIDEEQRFGEELKAALGRSGADYAHVLAMTATPIPRTMQSALVGLRDVSVIATAPVHRQPTRTFVLEFDPVIVRDALMREHARGGQSFIVCPRIADLRDMAASLAELVPGLAVVQAHGRMKSDSLESAVVRFAAGEGDVLLATDIIEAGLDIPRANTIVVTNADRFGLAQLHQMRGRVGRGRRRGAAFLTTAPGHRLAGATRARLRTLETLSSLGAGVALSAADLDQRGAGDLFGAAQAGHVSALGTDLYQHLLLRAVESRRGVAPPPPTPELHVGLTGRIPEEMVPEPNLRLSLYRRLARLTQPAEVDAFAEELEDRFGEIPSQLAALLALARLRCLCAALGVARLDAGPKGATARPDDPARLQHVAAMLGGTVREDRVVLPVARATGAERVMQLTALLGARPPA